MVNKNKNKTAHTTNGNTMHYKVMQVNSSNCDFNSKLNELRSMIDQHKSEILLISEANTDVDDKDKWMKELKRSPNTILKINW